MKPHKKTIIYYTDNRLEENVALMVRNQLLKSGLPIVSCSLAPINFGENIVLNLKPGPVTMFKQILTALKASSGEFVFFCEHDVLYHPSHFDFTPSGKDVFYYNTNVWRWDFSGDRVITYDHFRSVSGICVNREKAIEHYEKRLKLIFEKGWDKVEGRNPKWARAIGYEPGKLRKNGGFSKDAIEEWRSGYPNIDIRHKKTITPIKMTLENFIHKPTGWKESKLDKLPGWDIKRVSV